MTNEERNQLMLKLQAAEETTANAKQEQSAYIVELKKKLANSDNDIRELQQKNINLEDQTKADAQVMLLIRNTRSYTKSSS